MGYHEAIEALAKNVGYKAANIAFLAGKLEEFTRSPGNNIEVLTPPSVAINHEAVLAHIEKHDSPNPKNTLLQLWKNFQRE